MICAVTHKMSHSEIASTKPPPGGRLAGPPTRAAKSIESAPPQKQLRQRLKYPQPTPTHPIEQDTCKRPTLASLKQLSIQQFALDFCCYPSWPRIFDPHQRV